MRHSVARMNKTNSQEVQSQQRRWLENQRTKLLRAHYEDAIPLKLLKAEQARTTREIADAEEVIRERQTEYAAIEANLDKALKLASACGREYAKASPIVRRLFNQAFFEKFVIENGDIVEAPFTRPVAVVIKGAREARHLVAALRSSWEETARTRAWGVEDQGPRGDFLWPRFE